MSTIGTFLRGLLMGICDVVPGISGGTIAFITGIYERLMKAVSAASRFSFKDLFTGKFQKAFKPLDLPFLLPLVVGILIAILIGAKGILYLLTNYTSQTLIFFVGLILASSVSIYKEIKHHKSKDIGIGILALSAGALLTILSVGTITQPSYVVVFLSGFIAISAMFLPGISGSFILLLIGMYQYMLTALDSFNLLVIVVFAAGAVCGALVISRVITYLFKHFKEEILYGLLGLVIGSLGAPLQQISFSIPLVLYFIAGLLVVVGIHQLQTRTSTNL